MPTFKKILVPIDFSSHSQSAIRVAADLARRYEASLTLLHVYQPVSLVVPDGFALFTPMQMADMLSEFSKLLQATKREAELAGAPRVEAAQRQGVPATEIVDFAKTQGCDLIVMGTHGRTGVAHAVMGSVAERVVRMSACPVLTLRPKDA